MEVPVVETVPAASVVATSAATAPPDRVGRSTSRVRVVFPRRWKSAAAVIGAAAVAAGAYTLAGGDDDAQPRPITAAAPEPALRLDAILADGGKPVLDGVAYEVFEAAQDAEGNRKRIEGSSAYAGPPKFVLPPGRYYVTATYGSASANTEVDLQQATLTLQTLNLRAGVIRPTAVLTDGAKPLPDDVSYTVDEAAADVEGNRQRVAQSSVYSGPPRFVLPTGRYVVSATHGSASATEEIEVTAGDNTAVPLNLRAGVLHVSARLATGSPILEGNVGYDVYEAAADEEGNRKKIVSSSIYSGPPRLPLPAGRYYVTAEYGSASASVEADVAAGEIERLVLDLRAGVLSVAAIGNGGQPLADGVEYAVYEAARDVEGNRRRVTSSSVYAGPPTFPLPAGQYVITAESKQGKTEAEVTIAAGEERRLELRLKP